MRVTDERLMKIRDRIDIGAHLLNSTQSKEVRDIIADLQDSRVEIARLRRVPTHPLPLVKVRDKGNRREHIVGFDIHDMLLVEEDGSISYMNLQNGEGTGSDSCYEFVTEFDGCWTTIPWSEGD